jgi:hypothetical protein
MKIITAMATYGILFIGIFTGMASANNSIYGLEKSSQYLLVTNEKQCKELIRFNLEEFKSSLGSKMGTSMFRSVRLEDCKIKIDNYYLQLVFSQWAFGHIRSTLTEMGFLIVKVDNENIKEDGNMRFGTKVIIIEEIPK